MTLHLLCGRWLPIVCPPSGAFRNGQKGLYHQSSMYPDSGINPSSVVHPVTRGILDASYQRFTLYCHHRWCINLVALWLILIVWHKNNDNNKEKKKKKYTVQYHERHFIELLKNINRTMKQRLDWRKYKRLERCHWKINQYWQSRDSTIQMRYVSMSE